jgi:Cu2+-exporting ATPase
MRKSIRFLPTADKGAGRHDAARFALPPCEARAEMEIGQLITEIPFSAPPVFSRTGEAMSFASGSLAMAGTSDLSHFVRHLDGGVARMELAVDGLLSAGCTQTIEGGLSAIPDITLARVNLADRCVAVEWRDGKVDPVRFINRLSELGFRAYPYDAGRSAAGGRQAMVTLLCCLGVAALAALAIVSLPAWCGMGADISPGQRDFLHGLAAVIALPAAAFAGRPFFVSALRAVAAGRLNPDVPVSAGLALALGLSVVETLGHAVEVTYDSALMLLAFVLIGRLLEQASLQYAPADAGNLATAWAATVTRFVSDTELAEVPAGSVRPGDLVLVRPGERIAVDGIVSEGRSEIDQSLCTGETLPVCVRRDSAVYAGTLNVSGTLRIKVGAAERTALLNGLGRTHGHAREACQASLSDRAARLYPPLVLAAALMTFVGWVASGADWQDAVMAAIAVLIMTYPAALGVAVSAVHARAAGALSTAGVLLSSGEGIERLAGVDTILFDKTGTLTLPEPHVINAADIPPERLALAGRLALASRHPLAGAVVRAARATSPLPAIEEPGQGVRSVFQGVALRLGKPSFCGAERRAAAVLESDPEASAIAFSYGVERYVLAVRQQLRSDAIETIAQLKQDGFAIEILSGDHAPAVAHLARTLGIERWQAVMPAADKTGHISVLQAQGRNVLMVGDGINDAPSLAAADAALSVGTAAPLTLAAADAVFAGDRLTPVLSAVAIARRALGLMHQNLVFTAAYTAVAAPVAVLGLASPLAAALAMSAAAAVVALNARRASGTRALPWWQAPA